MVQRTVLALLFTATALVCSFTPVGTPVRHQWKTDVTTAIQERTQVLEKYSPTSNTHYSSRYFRHCSQAYSLGWRDSGVYLVKLDQKEPFEVFCDMETGGGGWTVVQRQADGSTDFNKPWKNYVNGFGNISDEKSTEFWLGLEKLYRLTQTDTD